MTTRILPLFASHPRQWRENRYVYPVISRRSGGLSIGINLNPDKACNFDCVYCSVDRRSPASEPSRRVDLAAIEAELNHMLDLAVSGEIYSSPPFDQTPAHLRRLNDIAFSGDGEPTAYSGFSRACELVVRMLGERKLSEVQPIVITNATLLNRKPVREGIAQLAAIGGKIWAKLDAGTEGYYKIVERTSVPLSRVLQNIAAAGRRWPIVVQSMFIRMGGTEPPETEIDEYVARLRALRLGGCQIERVQLYTVARPPAESNVSAVSEEFLREVAKKVRALRLEACVYPG
ncbi:MAG TPA: radical SAM protein [Tepidisphaeraceae bacterium]|nr:radical SAM protein [Tepidisphaeraceae bacterium]